MAFAWFRKHATAAPVVAVETNAPVVAALAEPAP